MGVGGRLVRRAYEARLGIAHGFVTGKLAVVSVVIIDEVDDVGRGHEGAQRVRDRFAVQLNLLPRQRPGQALGQRVLTELVPIRQHDVFASRRTLQRLLQLEQVDAVPGREQHVAVVAVAAPIASGSPTRPAEWCAVITGELVKRLRVGGWARLHADPGTPEIFERFPVSVLVILLQLLNGSPDTQRLPVVHH